MSVMVTGTRDVAAPRPARVRPRPARQLRQGRARGPAESVPAAGGLSPHLHLAAVPPPVPAPAGQTRQLQQQCSRRQHRLQLSQKEKVD